MNYIKNKGSKYSNNIAPNCYYILLLTVLLRLFLSMFLDRKTPHRAEQK